MVSDPISNMLIGIKNAQASGKKLISMPYSKVNFNIAQLLVKNGYLSLAKKDMAEDKPKLVLSMAVKPISHIKRISKPGHRRYCRAKLIPQLLRGSGLIILSTNQGIITGNTASAKGIGGEIICEVY